MNDLEQEQWDALLDRCESWKALACRLDDLLVYYRLGSLPSGKLLDRIRRLKDRLSYEAARTTENPS